MKDKEAQNSIKNILSKSSVPKAPADMSLRVLEAWKAREVILTTAPPIISARVWWGLLSAITAIVVYAFANSNPKSNKWPEYFSWLNVDFKSLVPAADPVLLISLTAISAMILINIAHVRKSEMG